MGRFIIPPFQEAGANMVPPLSRWEHQESKGWVSTSPQCPHTASHLLREGMNDATLASSFCEIWAPRVLPAPPLHRVFARWPLGSAYKDGGGGRRTKEKDLRLKEDQIRVLPG